MCCLINRAKVAAGGPLTKFIKRGLEASQCAAVGPIHGGDQAEEGRSEGKVRGREEG